MNTKKITDSKLLKNIFYAALHHRDSARMRKDDLLNDDYLRTRDAALYDAYAYIVQLIEYRDTIGMVNYKKVFDMKEKFPTESKALPHAQW